MKKLLTCLVSTIFFITIIFGTQFNAIQKAQASPNYNALATDAAFVNTYAMSAAEIQAFLVSQGSFLQNFSENGRSAAQIIYDAAHGINMVGDSGGWWPSAANPKINIDTTGTINPIVILATIQKEEGLVSGYYAQQANYNQTRVNWAMGYAVCDSCDINDPHIAAYSGFTKQVNWGAASLRWNYERAQGQGYNDYQVSQIVNFDGVDVTLSNRATASLFRYTPHLQGNGNFQNYFQLWGGEILNSYDYQIVSQSATHPVFDGDTLDLRVVIKNTGRDTWTKDTVKLGRAYVPTFALAGLNQSAGLSNMDEDSVMNGANATFNFQLQIPYGLSAKTYVETFRPIVNGLVWMKDADMTWQFPVSKSNTPQITGQFHSQNVGWQTVGSNGQFFGTTGQALRLEAIKPDFFGLPVGTQLEYRAHVQNVGWQPWVNQGQIAGTTGQGLRIEAIQIRFKDGYNPQNLTINYRAHVQGIGWQDWVSNGATAGTTGQFLRAEALQVALSYNTPTILEQGQAQNIGWQPMTYDGQIIGTTGQGLRLEAIKLNLVGVSSDTKLEYRTYIQGTGWQPWMSQDQMAGTVGQALRIEAVQIRFKDGYNPQNLVISYRAHVQGIGWQDWVSNGATAGTTGQNLRVEALQVMLTSKAQAVLSQAHFEGTGWKNLVYDNQSVALGGSGLRIEALRLNLVGVPTGTELEYRGHAQYIGWQNWVTRDQMTGTTGRGLRLEALQVRFKDGANSGNLHISYRAYVQGIGWQDWVSDGATAGTVGQSLKIEDLQIKIVSE